MQGRTLCRYELEPDGDDSLDYIDDHHEVYEMKLVTPEEYNALRARQRFVPSSTLAMHWSILLDAPTMDDKFRPMPEFPDDDPALIAALEADGFTVISKAEREAAWRERYSGRRIRPQLGKREEKELEQHLLVLERAGIDNTRGALGTTAVEREAIRRIHVLTHGAICMARPSRADAGIFIRVGWGYTRTGDPNVFAFRVQEWLDSPLGANLVQSLRQPRFTRRHGVLSFDSSEPEWRSAHEHGLDFVPTVSMTLPPDVDVLWCAIGPLLLRYDADGWQSFDTTVGG